MASIHDICNESATSLTSGIKRLGFSTRVSSSFRSENENAQFLRDWSAVHCAVQGHFECLGDKQKFEPSSDKVNKPQGFIATIFNKSSGEGISQDAASLVKKIQDASPEKQRLYLYMILTADVSLQVLYNSGYKTGNMFTGMDFSKETVSQITGQLPGAFDSTDVAALKKQAQGAGEDILSLLRMQS